MMRIEFSDKLLGKFEKIWEFLALFAIVLLGFGLRFYKVGKDSFWLDEAGQASAAIQPHLIGILMIVRQHAGAMPLDYLVSHIMASISMNEKIMRFPSVLWGTLSIIAYFLLVRELDLPNKKLVSFLSAMLLAISPLYIQYSQEMRFYAALVFFYIISTFFLIRAIKGSSTRNWIIYILITAIGIYFHPYVFFTIITGFIFIFGEYIYYLGTIRCLSHIRYNILKFIMSSIFLAIIYLPGYLFFNAKQSFSSDLGFNLDAVLKGLGLTAIRWGTGLEPFGLWHIVLIIGAVCGLFLIITKHKKYRLMLYVLIAFLLQFFLIVWLDVYKQYFFAARQIIHLAPLVLLLASISIVELVDAVKSPLIKNIILFMILGALCISPMPYIKAIYTYSKGSGREIAQEIISKYTPNQKVLIFSSSYKVILDYYFLRFDKSGSTMPFTLVANNIDELGNRVNTMPEIEYVVAPRDTTGDIRALIVSFGFKAVPGKSDADFLFVRSP